jgi:hypothetical protein
MLRIFSRKPIVSSKKNKSPINRSIMEELDGRVLMTAAPTNLNLVVDTTRYNSFYAKWDIPTTAVSAYDITVQSMDGTAVNYSYVYNHVMPGNTLNGVQYLYYMPTCPPDSYRVELVAYDANDVPSTPVYANTSFAWLDNGFVAVDHDSETTVDNVRVNAHYLFGQADYLEIQRKDMDREGATWQQISTMSRVEYEALQSDAGTTSFFAGYQQNPPGEFGYRLLSHIYNTFDSGDDVSIVINTTTITDTVSLVMDSYQYTFSWVGKTNNDYATANFTFHILQNGHAFTGHPSDFSYSISSPHDPEYDAWFLYDESYGFGSSGSEYVFINGRVPIVDGTAFGYPNTAIPGTSTFSIDLYYDFGDARGVQLLTNQNAFAYFQ